MGMRLSLRKSVFLPALLAAVLASKQAFAVDTMGQLLTETMNNIEGFSDFESMLAYCMGALLCVVSLFKFKDYVDNPAQTPLSAGLKRFIAGGMLLSLPFMAGIVQGSVYNGGIGNNSIGGTSALDPTVMTNTNGLDVLVVNFMMDVAVPFEWLLSCFVYLMAGGLLLVGINRLTKRMDEGPRGPAGMGTLMTFITSGVLFAWGDVAGAMTNSIFNPTWKGSSLTSTTANVDTTIFGTAALSIDQVIQGVMLFVTLVGMIAFVRGWLVLRAFADGQQGATLAQGLTFLVGGVLAINLGDLVNSLQATVGVSGITFT